MQKKLVLSMLLSVWCLCLPASAFVAPDNTDSKQPLVKNCRQASSNCIEKLVADVEISSNADLVVFSADGSVISSLRGNFPLATGASDENAIRSFLLEHAPLFNLHRQQGCLNFAGAGQIGRNQYFHYNMLIDGMPVENAEIVVHLGANNCIKLINGVFPEIDAVETAINITSQQAERRAEDCLKIISKRAGNITDRLIHLDGKTGRACYRVQIAANKPLGDWEILIDGKSGEEISRRNLMVYFDGKGSTYVSHPLKCEPTVETLPDLVDNTLRGKFADIHNDETSNAVSDDKTFVYPTHNLHFNEAMMYYLVNKVHGFFAKLGYDKLDTPIKAVVRYKVLYDNAFFSVLENALYFGDGYKFNDLAREESVCFHEYAHAARHQIVKLKYEGESGAIDEGQADYFAASLSEDPIIGEFIVAKMNRPWLRNLTEANHYPENIVGQVHEDGKIWGCALWDLRKALGSEVSDQLILNSLYYLPGDATFLHGLNALVSADEATFNSKHRATILEVLGKRGINQESAARYSLTHTQMRQIRRFHQLQEATQE